jgi:hypothetical protein
MQYDAHIQAFYAYSMLSARRDCGARLPWEGWGDNAQWWMSK